MRVSSNMQIQPERQQEAFRQPMQPSQAYRAYVQQYPQEGYLQAQVYAGQRGFPIPDVEVEIYKMFPSGKYSIDKQRTDISGLTVPVALPTHPAEESQHPGNVQPYSTYEVRFTHPDYTEIIVHNVSIFEGITSLQEMELIPKGAAPGGQQILQFDILQNPLQ